MPDYEKGNKFLPDGGFLHVEGNDNPPIRIRCPHCQSVGIFQSAVPRGVRYGKSLSSTSKTRSAEILASIKFCPNKECGGIVFALSEAYGSTVVDHIFPPELLGFDPSNLPDALVRTLKEALLCHSQGAYRASTMMVRRLLEELCHENEVSGHNLHERIKALRTKIVLPEELFEAMEELKALGNDAAHIEARAYNAIDREESQLSIELAQEILKARYQHKSLVERLRRRRNTAE
jgi:hypothetical protein